MPESNRMNVIEINNLTKIYSGGKNKVTALDNLTLKIKEGTIFGLLGPNGAGKTTLVKILLGIAFPTSGTADILGKPINTIEEKKRIGFLPENHRYPLYLNGGDVLRFYGKLSGLNGISLEKRIDELLELVKLSGWKRKKVRTYSKGMMQRLGLAQAFINDPDLIFLDEPTDGVDPIGRKEIRDILLELKKRNKTIFLNSHLLSEVELITDNVAIVNRGKLIREGLVRELTEKGEEYKFTIDKDADDLKINLNSNYTITDRNKNNLLVKVTDLKTLNTVIDELRSQDILIKEIIPQRTTLEDTFISLIKEAEKGE